MIRSKAENLVLEKRLNCLAAVVTAIVFILVSLMRRPEKLDLGIDFSFLPAFHSTMNALTAVLLIAALFFIKNGNMEMHRRLIYAALTTSALFLLSYVVYHFTTPETLFGDANHDGLVSPDEKLAVGSLRGIYLILLLTHIALAAIGLPFILLTFNRAFTEQYDRHKRMARWVFWVWLYIAVTGPICYLMLRPFYG